MKCQSVNINELTALQSHWQANSGSANEGNFQKVRKYVYKTPSSDPFLRQMDPVNIVISISQGCIIILSYHRHRSSKWAFSLRFFDCSLVYMCSISHPINIWWRVSSMKLRLRIPYTSLKSPISKRFPTRLLRACCSSHPIKLKQVS